jgi:hypothetical protein
MNADLPIESLRNLDHKRGQRPREARMTTGADLGRLGLVVVYRLVKRRQPRASINLLWPLAAGLMGKDWRAFTETTKMRLRKRAEEE